MTSERILSITKKIIRKAAEIGLDHAGSLIMPGAWPYFKKVISPVVDELERRYPKMLLVDDEAAIPDAEKAVEQLSSDNILQQMLQDSFSSLEQGQEEILDELDRIDEILKGIGSSIDHLSDMTEEGFNKLLKAIKQSGKKAPGELRIVDIRVTQNKRNKNCGIDFWVSNDGGSQVIILDATFEVIDTARAELIKGPMKASGSYDLDITDLREAGQRISCPISHEVKPGESDRFNVTMKAENLGTGVFAAWLLIPRLSTNYGEIEGKEVEVWLPFRDGTFEELKLTEKMEKSHGGKPSTGGTEYIGTKNENEFSNSNGGKISDDMYFDQLINSNDFSEFNKHLEELSFRTGNKEKVKSFIESERFGRAVQRRIVDAVGVRDIALCLSHLSIISKDAAKIILNHRGFGFSILPEKLNQEEDIEDIGLCLELIGICAPTLLEVIADSDVFDIEHFIERINRERDVYKIGHAIERVWREDRALAKKLVERDSLDIEGLAEKIKAENDVDKVRMCLGGIEWASPKIAEKIKDSL